LAEKILQHKNGGMTQVSEMERAKARIRMVYSQYISEHLPFYLDLLVIYLKNLVQQQVYTLEDIEVFSLVMKMYRLGDDAKGDEKRSETEELDADLTQPKHSRASAGTQDMYVMDGFVSLEAFK